jgi:hypothetical protein
MIHHKNPDNLRSIRQAGTNNGEAAEIIKIIIICVPSAWNRQRIIS